MKRCFFLGHRDAPESISKALERTIESLILDSEVEEFIVGNYGRFDTLVQQTLAQLKKKYPHITLMLLLPYHPAVKKVALPSGFDSTLYPEDMERIPKRFAIVKANRYALEHSNYFLVYLRYPGSNTAKLVECAKSMEKKGKLHVIVI